MYANPPIGTCVRIHYAERKQNVFTLEGKVGVVVVRGRGTPRNHGVEIDGVMHVVPCGNLNKVTEVSE